MTNFEPEGYTSVAPWVVTDDTGAFLDFVTSAFGGVELARIAVKDGTIGHGEIRVGDTVVLAFDRRPGWPSMPSLLRVFFQMPTPPWPEPLKPVRALSPRRRPTPGCPRRPRP